MLKSLFIVNEKLKIIYKQNLISQSNREKNYKFYHLFLK